MSAIFTSTFNMLNNAAHAVAPSMFEQPEDASLKGKSIPVPPPLPTGEVMHKHFLIPLAPPLPTDEDMNKHYLSRDKTIENASNYLRSAANYVMEVATDLTHALPSASDLGLATKLDSRGIPVPPPLPTQAMMHKHYLIPLAPPLPTRAMMHKHYLIPLAPPMPTKEQMNRHYLSRNKALENVQSSVQSAATYVSEVATDLSQSLLRSAPVAPISSQEHIPVPPPLPTREVMHKHYLIPLAPPMPTKEQMNRHYLSRNKTLENVQSSAMSAFNYVSEVAKDLKDYVMETPITSIPSDIKEVILPTPIDSEGRPIPPPLPTREMMHKHYLIPLAPPMPTKEQMNRHYLSRNKTLENVQSSVQSAATYVSEVAADLTQVAKSSAVSTVSAISNIPQAAADAGSSASARLVDASSSASESISSTATQIKEVVLEKAQELKEKVVPTISNSKGSVYTRGTGVSESPILRKNVPAGSRRIVARQNYEGFKPLLQ